MSILVPMAKSCYKVLPKVLPHREFQLCLYIFKFSQEDKFFCDKGKIFIICFVIEACF